MDKPLPLMSARELRAALDGSIAAERAAEYQEGLQGYFEARKAALDRQFACLDEMARRQAHFDAVNGAMGGLSG